MRSAVRKRRAEGEEESVFVSMTDMTVSFLFIVMILLAFFASQFRPDELVAKVELDEVVRQLEASQLVVNQQAEEIELLRRQIELLEASDAAIASVKVLLPSYDEILEIVVLAAVGIKGLKSIRR